MPIFKVIFPLGDFHKVSINGEFTIGDLKENILEHLEIDEAFNVMFGIYLETPEASKLISETVSISDLNETSVLLFRVVQFYLEAPPPSALPYPVLRMVYNQSRESVRTGYWHIEASLGYQLAAASVIAELGTGTKKSGFLMPHLDFYLPTHLRIKPKKAEKQVLSAFNKLCKTVKTYEEAICHYITLLQLHAHQYGMHIFGAMYTKRDEEEIGNHVLLGVDEEGLHILDEPAQAQNGFYEMKDITSYKLEGEGPKAVMVMVTTEPATHHFETHHAEQVMAALDAHKLWHKMPQLVVEEEETPEPELDSPVAEEKVVAPPLPDAETPALVEAAAPVEPEVVTAE